MYAVFQTTITQWAFIYDCVLVALFYLTLVEAGYYSASENGAQQPERSSRILLWALFLGHMLFSKTIKLVPHLLRNPGDVRMVIVSILFGYFHNLIKLYGFLTVTEVGLVPAHLFLRALLTGRRRHGAPVKAPMPTTTSGCCPSRRWPRSRRQ